ncbi:MAG: hypothetical protein RXR32_03425 [Candidatus Micrarchaeota archaeon]
MKLDKIAREEYKEVMHSKIQDFGNIGDPYINSYIIRCGRKKLAVISGRHRSNDKIVFNLMEKAFKAIKPKVVLLEQPKDHKVEQFIEFVKNKDKKFWNEFDAAADLAVRNKADLYFIDISDKEHFESFMQMKDGIKLYILFFFSGTYKTIFNIYNKTRKIENEDYKILSESFLLRDIINDDRIYNAFIKVKEKEYRNIGLIATIDRVVEETTRKYTGKKLSHDLIIYGNLTAPFPFANYEISKIIELLQAKRDSIMLHEIINHLKKADSVMFVCGSGHAATMKKYLLRELKRFGKCALEKIE